MKGKNRKWWLLGFLTFFIIALAAIFFWDAILIRIAPKTMMTSALVKLFAQMEERFQDDPLLVVAKSVNSDGQYAADMTLETENNILGAITYDMEVYTDGTAHRFFANGSVAASEKTLDLSAYLDADFMAVSSEDLLNGNYYGITYSTFAADVRKIPLLSFLVSDSLLSQWNDSVLDIQKKVSRTYAVPKIPELSSEDLEALLLGIVTVQCQVEKCSVLLDGNTVSCYRLDYNASGEQVDAFLSEITDGACGDGATVTASFYLYQNTIVRIVLACEEDGSVFSYGLDLGTDPAQDAIILHSIRTKDKDTEEWSAVVTTQHSEGFYAESWDIYKTTGGTGSQVSICFEWNTESGDLILETDTEKLQLNLTKTEDGFRLETDDFAQLLRIWNLRSEDDSNKQISCVLNVRKGAEIVTPDYRNLDQWSMSDFLVLVSGIGSLLGISLQTE